MCYIVLISQGFYWRSIRTELFEYVIVADIPIVSQPSKCLKLTTFREGCFVMMQLNASA